MVSSVTPSNVFCALLFPVFPPLSTQSSYLGVPVCFSIQHFVWDVSLLAADWNVSTLKEALPLHLDAVKQKSEIRVILKL